LCLSNGLKSQLPKSEKCPIQFLLFGIFFLRIMSGSILLHRPRSPEDLQQVLAWYKIRDTLFGENGVARNIKKALELASVCEHPNAIWLIKLLGGRDVASRDEATQILLGCENDPRALSFAGVLLKDFEEIRQAAELGDAFAQAWMAWRTGGGAQFRWAEKSAAQGERDGFCQLGHCYLGGKGCEQDVERAKENYLTAGELGHVHALVRAGQLFDKDYLQRFICFARAASNGSSSYFLNEMSDQINSFSSGTRNAKVVFVIGRALKGQVNSEEGTIFGNRYSSCFAPANKALRFYEFQLQSYRKAVDSWTIVGLRNGVVKDIRKMIGKMIWDAREEAAYLEDREK
jgi:hypothetical protein